MNTTKKTLLIVVALTFCATALYAASYAPGFIHEERGCMRFGGRLVKDGDGQFQRTGRLVCEARVHRFARRDAMVRYLETNDTSNGYNAAEDPVLFSLPAGKCR